MKASRGSRGIDLLFLYLRCYMGVGGQHHGSAALLAGNPDTHSTAGWVGLTTGLVGCRKSRRRSPPPRDSNPGSASPYRAVTPTELHRPTKYMETAYKRSCFWHVAKPLYSFNG
jgi:hypothetical protein